MRSAPHVMATMRVGLQSLYGHHWPATGRCMTGLHWQVGVQQAGLIVSIASTNLNLLLLIKCATSIARPKSAPICANRCRCRPRSMLSAASSMCSVCGCHCPYHGCQSCRADSLHFSQCCVLCSACRQFYQVVQPSGLSAGLYAGIFGCSVRCVYPSLCSWAKQRCAPAKASCRCQ